MADHEDRSMMLRSPLCLARTDPGAQRILSGMAGDVLSVAQLRVPKDHDIRPLKDGDIPSADAPEEKDQRPLPRAARAKLLELADETVDSGAINSPEDLVREFTGLIGPKVVKYLDAIWNILAHSDETGKLKPGSHDWPELYAQLSQADTGTSTGAAPEPASSQGSPHPCAPAVSHVHAKVRY